MCGGTWRTPADRQPGLTITYDDFYQNLRNLGIQRHPPPDPVAQHRADRADLGRPSRAVRPQLEPNYLNDLRSMITKARAAGIMVILDMQQDFRSPALHNITNWDGAPGIVKGTACRGGCTHRSTSSRPPRSDRFYNGMNWFFRNIHDPMATVTRVTPWELYGDVWKMFPTSSRLRPAFLPTRRCGRRSLQRPWWSYVGGSPPAGQTVAQAAGSRLHAFYTGLAPSITANTPNWLLFFQDTGGGTTARTRVFASRHR